VGAVLNPGSAEANRTNGASPTGREQSTPAPGEGIQLGVHLALGAPRPLFFRPGPRPRRSGTVLAARRGPFETSNQYVT
jgi:hypothetical protein